MDDSSKEVGWMTHQISLSLTSFIKLPDDSKWKEKPLVNITINCLYTF